MHAYTTAATTRTRPTSPPTPGFAGEAVNWLFDARSILATGSDILDPHRSTDADGALEAEVAG